MVVGEGFEPSKLSRQIYSLIPLTARESHLYEGAHSCLEHKQCQPIQATTTNALCCNTATFTRSRVVPAPGVEPGTY